MSVDLATATQPSVITLDGSRYALDEEESKFYKSQTGIQDDERLREHLFKVQAEALGVRECTYSP